jgi:5-(carboxyamino)imidazole ribonucleotide mutase
MAENVEEQHPLVSVVVGSKSDWETMRHTDEILTRFGIPHENRIFSAHRTPQACVAYAESLEQRGVEVVIAGAGMSAALPGVLAANTTVPVLGVPMMGNAVQGLDSLFSIVQMPPGIPVGTLGVGKPGATNAALLAIAILAISRPSVRLALLAFREEQAAKVLAETLP